MKWLNTLLLAGLCTALCWSEAIVGQPAPEFRGTTCTGASLQLADYKGKYVVLEWLNHDCPFVRAQYDPGAMQALQKKWTAQGVVWLSICSSAEGKQGYLTPEAARQSLAAKSAAPSALLLDPSGDIGRLYGAKTTPHMFVLSPQGKVLYAGAIDDRGQVNYVDQALQQAHSGQPIAVPQTVPYGCSVKYQGP